jgi:hypothetical protein
MNKSNDEFWMDNLAIGQGRFVRTMTCLNMLHLFKRTARLTRAENEDMKANGNYKQWAFIVMDSKVHRGP